MPGKPFASKLTPHFEVIRAMRKGGKAWAEIAAHLTAHGTPTSASNVYEFFVRHRRRPAPVGMEPEPEIPTPRASSILSKTTEKESPKEAIVDEDDFLKPAEKPIWTIKKNSDKKLNKPE